MSILNVYSLNPLNTNTASIKESILKSNKPYVDAMFEPKINLLNQGSLVYNSTFVPISQYKELNNNKSIQKTLSKYYYYKILDKWIYNELFPLLAFIEIDKESGKPKLIKNLIDYDVEKVVDESKSVIEKKIDYMEEVLINKDMVRHVLKKICHENKINWGELKKHDKTIKYIFYNYLLDKLKTVVKSINK